jgi:hypothetical protein
MSVTSNDAQRNEALPPPDGQAADVATVLASKDMAAPEAFVRDSPRLDDYLQNFGLSLARQNFITLRSRAQLVAIR